MIKNKIRDFLKTILEIPSPSGEEANLFHFFEDYFRQENLFNVQSFGGDRIDEGAFILLTPKEGSNEQVKVLFCTHIDTVENDLPIRRNDDYIFGRGAVDAKGQIAAIYGAALNLLVKKENNFGILLVTDEERTSKGAKLANKIVPIKSDYIVISEPTENSLAVAGKGILTFDVEIKGRQSHSGYPQYGLSALDIFFDFWQKLKNISYAKDEILGDALFNIGLLNAPNSANVIADFVRFRVMFRTTFLVSPNVLKKEIDKIVRPEIKITYLSESPAIKFYTPQNLKNINHTPVSFGSDAQHLTNFGKCLMYGISSIKYAHSLEEKLDFVFLDQGIADLEKIYWSLA